MRRRTSLRAIGARSQKSEHDSRRVLTSSTRHKRPTTMNRKGVSGRWSREIPTHHEAPPFTNRDTGDQTSTRALAQRRINHRIIMTPYVLENRASHIIMNDTSYVQYDYEYHAVADAPRARRLWYMSAPHCFASAPRPRPSACAPSCICPATPPQTSAYPQCTDMYHLVQISTTWKATWGGSIVEA